MNVWACLHGLQEQKKTEEAATGINKQGRLYHIGGCKEDWWYNKQPDQVGARQEEILTIYSP
jgi:hypothetical protein